jgi:hypothetical protein
MCDEPYTRPLRLFPSDGLVVPVRCTFIENHGANHSWYALQVADETELEKLRTKRHEEAALDVEDDLPAEVASLTLEIEAGEYDPYLEILLAYLHDRKKCLRGVKGFTRSRRTA